MATGGARIRARVLAGPLALLTLVFWAFAFALPAAAAAPAVSFSAALDGRSLSSISSNDPLPLSSAKPLTVEVSVTNHGSTPITVAAARIQGRVMGVSFFSYDTQIALRVPAGGTERTTFSIGLADLAGQATGLLPTTMSLLNANSAAIASQDFSVDVHGHLTSIYGVFGLAVAAITILWLVSLIYRVARRSLPGNRWTRAVQFAVAGFGLGLTLTFSVSALTLLTPNAAVWAPFVFGAGAVGFAVGYLTPGPRVVDPDEEERFIASRSPQPAYAGAIGTGDGAAAIGPGAQPALEAQRPWQGEIERTPLGRPAELGAVDAATTPRPVSDGLAPQPAEPAQYPGPAVPDDATTQIIPSYPGAGPSGSSAPTGPVRHDDGTDDRETAEVDRSDFDAFFRSDQPRDQR